MSGGARPFVTFYNTQARWCLLVLRLLGIKTEDSLPAADEATNDLSREAPSERTPLGLLAGPSPTDSLGAVLISPHESMASSPLTIQSGDARDSGGLDGVLPTARLADQVLRPARGVDHCLTTSGVVPGISSAPSLTSLPSGLPTLAELVDFAEREENPADVAGVFHAALSENPPENKTRRRLLTSTAYLSILGTGHSAADAA